jgi:hypothetical protein
MSKRKRIITLNLTEMQARAMCDLLRDAIQPPKNPKAFFCGSGKWANAAWRAYFKLEEAVNPN